MFQALFLVLLASPTALSLGAWVLQSKNEVEIQNETKNILTEEQETLPESASFEITNPDEVPEGHLFEKDILLAPQQKMAMLQRKAYTVEDYRWTKGSDGFPFVPYRFKNDEVDQEAVKAGISHWESHTCIKFGETNSTTGPHLMFFKGDGCYSYIGMIYFWDGQNISIGHGCTGLGTVVHEIGHAMGFYHEQSRSDRDEYLVVNEENVEDDALDNFKKAIDNNYSIAYDYTSDMHYGIDYFSKNGLPTLVTKDPLAQGLIGNRQSLSHRDKLLANKMYSCLDKWLSMCNEAVDPCQNEGYLGSDCDCVCPPGTSGSLCENKYADYYAELYSYETENVTTEKTIMTPNHPDNYPSDTRMTKYIIAPVCKTPLVTFSAFKTTNSSVNSKGFRTCPFAFLNIRKDGDPYVGQMYCGEDIKPGDAFRSRTREMMLYFYARNGYYTGWNATVKFEDSTDPSCNTNSTAVACSVPMGESKFTWRSPNFGIGNYPSNFMCILDRPSIKPSYVTYTLKTFKLQKPVKRMCVDNVTLTFPYGRTKVLCGEKTNKVYTSPTSYINAVFMTNANKNFMGFEIEVVAHQDSQYYQHIILNNTTTSGILTSPRYPKISRRHTAEYWIEAPTDKKVKVAIRDRLKGSKGCAKDYLLTSAYGDPMYQPENTKIYCGKDRTPTYLYSHDNKLYIVFNLQRGGSYRIEYYLVDNA